MKLYMMVYLHIYACVYMCTLYFNPLFLSGWGKEKERCVFLNVNWLADALNNQVQLDS